MTTTIIEAARSTLVPMRKRRSRRIIIFSWQSADCDGHIQPMGDFLHWRNGVYGSGSLSSVYNLDQNQLTYWNGMPYILDIWP